VWQAYDNITKSQVAVKVLHPNVAGDRIRLERFIRGARIMSTLEHDAIVRILQSSGEDGGYYYYVMDYIPGGSLHKAIVTGRLHPHRAIPIILRVSNALAAAHGKGVTHRDVKPANILLDDAGEPYLTDFDLVKAPDTTGGTRTGGLGTYIYAPPEMLTKPDEADARSDVYGLGMTTIFCLYGRDLPDAMMRRPGAFLRSKLRCDDKLRKVLKKSISLKPAARYANAAEFSEALSRANAVTMDDVFAHVQSEQTKKELSDANPKDELLAQLKAVEGNVEEENRLLRQVQERALQRLIARSSG
jgi:serine/threonine protein kinase